MAARPVLKIGSGGPLEEVDLEKYPVNSASTGTSVSLDFASYGAVKFTPNGNYTVSVSNAPPSGQGASILLFLTNGGAYTPTWPTVTWLGGVPTLDASGLDVILFIQNDGTLYGAHVGNA